MNLKGGCGKTTVTVNVAYLAAAIKNKRVLLVDNDPQGNASSFFKAGGAGKALPEIIENILKSYDMKDAIEPIIPYHTQYKRIDILTSNMALSTCNIEMSKLMVKEQFGLYSDIFKNIIQKYDLILIDNAPNITPLTVSALLASDEVIVPIEADKLTIDGLNEIINQIDDAKRSEFSNLKLGGILFNRFNCRARVDKQALEYIQNGTLTGGIKYKVYNTTIRQTVKVREATFAKKPLELAYKRSDIAQDYRNLIKEII